MKPIQAVLVRLSIGLFNNTRQDSGITKDVMALHKLAGKPGRWIKYKLPCESIEPIARFAGSVRQWHYTHTLPWEDGSQLLTLQARPLYDQQIAKFREEFNKHVAAFGEQYPGWIEQAKLMHNGTFNASDYPEWPTLKAMFHITTEYRPVPSKNHFTPDLASLYGDELEAANEKKVHEAMEDLWQRLLGPVSAMAEKLADKKAIFRDSLVDNVREILQLVPVLNLTGDAAVKQAAAQIQQQLAVLNPDTLRENVSVRAGAAKAASTIASVFGSKLGVRKFAA